MLYRILKSPYFISAVLVIVIYIFVKPELPKYSLKPMEFLTESGGDSIFLYTYDLDYDGNSEFIKFKASVIGKPAYVVYKNSASSIDQWNFEGVFKGVGNFKGFGDYDSDGFGEVYFLNYHKEALVMFYHEPMKDNYGQPDSIKICEFKPGTTYSDVFYNFNRMADVDGDGFKEIIVSVKTGFGIEPRSVYVISLKTRKIIEYSNNFNVLYCSEAFDLDKDNYPELFFDSKAQANMDINLPPEVNDYYTNAFVVDPEEENIFDNLYRAFSPNGYVKTCPFKSGNDTLILGLAYVEHSENPLAFFWDKSGNLMDSIILKSNNYPSGWEPTFFKHNFGKELIIGSRKGHIFTITEDRRFEEMGSTEFGWSYYQKLDINEDGKPEYLGISDENLLVIYSDNFSTKTQVKIPRPEIKPSTLNLSKYYNEGKPYLFLQTDSYTKIYQFEKDWMSWGQYLFLSAGILTLWIFAFLIQYQQRLQMNKKQKDKDEVSKLQFQAIANQINPHFSYNILNTIGYSVLHEDRNKAYQLLVKYSKLTRNLIEGGVEANRTLRQELGFVENFLELQKSRFEESFHFYIDIDSRVEQDMLVPRMILLTFVENSIKHGLSPKKGEKLLQIKVVSEKKSVVITIEDNGVGRNYNTDSKIESAGQGIEILNRIIDIHKKFHKKEISYEIIDLVEGDDSGTRVIITLN